MNDIQNIHPGKLKRKSKKSTSASVVDLPAVRTDTAPAANLLGDVILDPTTLKIRGDHDDSIDIGDANDSSEIAIEPQISLRPAEPEKHDESPLSRLSSRNEAVKTTSTESRSLSLATDLPAETDFSASRTKRKASRPKAADPETPQTPDTKKLQDILTEVQETNKQCLETLSRLQNTNIQNEKRYALNLILGFAVIAIIAAIGIFAAVNLKQSAQNSEFKFKQEAYNSAIEARNFLEAELEKERKSSTAAFEVYQQIESGNFVDAVEKFTEVRDQMTTHPAEIALLESKIDEIQQKLAQNAFDSGLLLFKASNYEQARDAFFKSLSHNEHTPYTPRLNYYLAMSLYQLGDFEGARRYFALINPSDLNPEMDAQARFYRAFAAEKLGDDDEAFEQFDQFLKKYRYHKLSDEAAKHRSKLETSRR
ncbi:MAG: tetratricopeptide repeat protein [Proteobacteria bacterium]|nr:tetratricopeptide repeat protein [Pseudomonadota bacterium]